MNHKLQVKDRTFPNGAPYKHVTFGDEVLGVYTATDGGWLPYGKRKPRETEFDAILELIRNKQRDAEKRISMLEDARQEVFDRQYEFRNLTADERDEKSDEEDSLNEDYDDEGYDDED